MKDNVLVVIILITILLMAVISIIVKKKCKASCCGSGTYVAKSRKLKNVGCTKYFQVDGMHCQNCVNRVMEVVQDIDGMSAAVNLKKGMLTVSMEKEIENAFIIAAVEKCGYTIKAL